MSELGDELDDGSRLALALVDHLDRMGNATSCVLTVEDRAIEYVIVVMPKATYEVTKQSTALLVWAVERWNAEVKNRPLVNIHRRTLDDTWRAVMRYAGGNPDELVGPDHDTLATK